MKRVLLLCAVLVVFLVLGQKVSWADGCPATTSNPIGGATACGTITVAPDGGLTFAFTSADFLGGSDDPLVEVINNSGVTLNSLYLTGPGLFAFNGDGLCSYDWSNTPDFCASSNDTTTYAGPTTTFSGYISTGNYGYVDFTGGLPDAGSSTYFSLETAPTGGSPVGIPEPGPAQLFLSATALSGLLMFVKRLRMA